MNPSESAFPSRSRVTLLVLLVAMAACGGYEGDPVPPQEVEMETDSAVSSVANVGFMTPESVLHDTTADVYLVTNINGPPVEKDNNGFVSRVSPAGEMLEVQWIAGGVEGVVLHAPKGMALRGDSLFVADLDTVRIFHRETGAALGGWGVAGATLLNDLSVGPDGTLYVTDTGLRAGANGGLEPSGTAAVYRFGADGTPEEILRGDALMNPNGVVGTEQGLVIVPFGGNQVFLVDAAGQQTTVATLPGGQLDGVERLADGTLLVTGWEGSAVYRVDPGGQVTTEVEGLDAPADLGYDATRNQIIVPLFNENRLEIRPVR